MDEDDGSLVIALALLLALPVLVYLEVALWIADPWSLLLPGGVIAFVVVRHLVRAPGRRAAAARVRAQRVARDESAARLADIRQSQVTARAAVEAAERRVALAQANVEAVRARRR